jgi:hypothetical protein
MTSDRNPRRVIIAEYIVQDSSAPYILIRWYFFHKCLPKKVLLGEPFLDSQSWKVVVDVRRIAAEIAPVTRNAFTK